MVRNFRLLTFVPFVLAALLFAGCLPMENMANLQMGDAMAEEPSDEMAESSEGEMSESESMEAMGDGATATIATRSLRVRQSPDESAEVVYGVSEGETFQLMGVSDDGQWVQIAIADAPDGNGWVSANFVTVSGALEGSTGDAPILEPTPAPEEEAMESEAMEEDAMDGDAMAEIVAPEAGYALVTTDGTRLRVRGEPNTEAEIVGYVYNGETYQLLGVSDDGVWVNIAGSEEGVSDNPEGGWVSAEFLIIGK